MYCLVSFPDPIPTRGKGSGVLRAISWASRMQNSHVILIIVMATHCLVCGSRMQQRCNTGLICAAGALSHEKSHAVNLIGAPEIRTATSSSPRNRSKYTRPSSPCRGGVWDRDYVLFTENQPQKCGCAFNRTAFEFSTEAGRRAGRLGWLGSVFEQLIHTKKGGEYLPRVV